MCNQISAGDKVLKREEFRYIDTAKAALEQLSNILAAENPAMHVY